ncbi:MAG TPA: hypothetical protein V6D19_02205 [Stenomitos sp.]
MSIRLPRRWSPRPVGVQGDALNMIVSIRLPRRWPLYLGLATVVFFCCLAPAVAQDVMGTTLNNMEESQKWWDSLWEMTFSVGGTGNNVTSFIMVSLAKKVLLFALIFWVFLFGRAMSKDSNSPDLFHTLGNFLLPVVLVALFLTNNGAGSNMLAYGMRQVINETTNGFMNIQIANIQVRSAIADQFITKDVAQKIERRAQICLQMPHPVVQIPSRERPQNPKPPLTTLQTQAYDYLECIDSLQKMVADEKANAEAKYCTNIPGVNNACTFFGRYINKVINSIQKIQENESNKLLFGLVPSVLKGQMNLNDIVSGIVATLIFNQILSFTQWLWVNTLELALWLSAISAPIFIALSLVPGRLNLTVSWLFSYLSIALAQTGYIAIVGAVAVMLTSSATYLTSDLRFPMALGLFAPGVSLALFTGGMWAAARSFTGQSTAVVGAVTSVASTTLLGFSTALSRLADKRR